MKLVYATLLVLSLAACGNAPGTTSQMEGVGSNASNLSATDSNGMAQTNETVSGTTTSKTSSGADDPAARSNDSANASEKGKGKNNADLKKKSAKSQKMDETRPGTEHDMTGGNESAH